MLKMVRQQMICIIAPRWSDVLMDFSETGDVYRALQDSVRECRGGSVRVHRAVAGKGGLRRTSGRH